MSRLIALLICLAVALLVVGCTGQPPVPESVTPSVTEEATAAPTDEAVEEATTEATEESAEVAETEAMTETEEMTGTEEISSTEEVSGSEEAAEEATPEATEEAAEVPSPFSAEILMNLAYSLEGVGTEPVQLTDGVYEDPANHIAVNWVDTYALGVLNEQPAAAVILLANTGGSGTFSYLAVVLEQDGEPVNVASTMLGDRITMNWITIANNEIELDLVTQGPDDPMCCATQRTSVNYVLEDDNALVNSSTTVIGVQEQITMTQVITYVPAVVPDVTQTGSCFSNAIGLGREDAWRCTTDDNVIHDPCFEVDDAPTIVCGADPVTGQTGFVLELTEPLPAPDPGAISTPWLIQLGDGTICGLSTGTVPGTADQTAPYACADDAHSYLMEDFIIYDIFWYAQSVVFDLGDEGFTIRSSVLTPVATVWQ